MSLDLSDVRVAFKAQSALGTLASGADATQIEVTPSQGMRLSSKPIESRLISPSRMKKRARPGSRSLALEYATEPPVGGIDGIIQAVLGASGWTASTAYSNTDWGNVVISGTGVTLTFASGTLITDGVRGGMWIKFTNLSVAGNNSVWAPILTVASETVCTVASGYLADNADDAAWNAVVARNVYTPTTYVKTYHTFEEYWGSVLDISKRGKDAVFNSLGISCQPNEYMTASFGLVGRDMDSQETGSAPIFTSPALVQGESLILLDGAIIVGGTTRTDFTGIDLTLEAPASTTDMLSTRVSPDVSLGQFSLSGTITGLVEDADDLATFLAETRFDLMLHFAENEADPSDFLGLYFGNLSIADFGTGAGGEGLAEQTLGITGGRDVRGTGYAPTTMLASTSYTP